jgi:sialic acid synthase SpsE
VRAIRPGGPITSKYLLVVLGRKLATSAKRGDALTWDLLA